MSAQKHVNRINVGGKEAFIGEFSERDLDRQITRLARQKVSKLEREDEGKKGSGKFGGFMRGYS